MTALRVRTHRSLAARQRQATKPTGRAPKSENPTAPTAPPNPAVRVPPHRLLGRVMATAARCPHRTVAQARARARAPARVPGQAVRATVAARRPGRTAARRPRTVPDPLAVRVGVAPIPTTVD